MAKILLVDDSKIQLKFVKKMLNDDGHDVTALSSGRDALRHINQGGIDLVISDLYMPGLDGFEIIAAMRAAAQPVPLIVMSANALACDVFRDAQAFGAAASLNKPFTAETLRSTIQTVLGPVPVAGNR